MKKMNVKRKNSFKVIRTILQAVLVLAIVFLAVQSWLFPKTYHQVLAAGSTVSSRATGDQSGFIALSYLGVEALDSQAKVVIPQQMLKKHLAALKASGFVTITQQQIMDYYQKGSPLPGRAMYLMFEDGNKDTAALAQGLLETNNYHASLWTYGQDLDGGGKQHLSSKELKELDDNSYWEAGVSGYRLAYINTFDRYGNYVGQLNRDEYYKAMPFLDRRYNHFLMDFIRDQDEVPLESNLQMAARIESEYDLMQQIFTEGLGKLPAGYTLMHANTGKFGSHDLVSAENERQIKERFQFNFNREGFAHNNREASIYDLTRMQPYAYWSPNHLLMRLQAETGENMAFVVGNQGQAKQFTLMAGKAEFDGNTLYLTTPMESRGLMRLNEAIKKGVELEAQLLGNVYGSQLFYLGEDIAGQNALGIGLTDNHLVVRQVENGEEKDLMRLNLAELEESRLLSKAEDEQQVRVGIMDAIILHDTDQGRIEEAKKIKQEALEQRPMSISEGAEAHLPPVDQLKRGNRHLLIRWQNGSLDVFVDGRHLVKEMFVSGGEKHVFIESRPIPAEYNQRNIYDPVYDGVFRNLTIRGTESDQQVYFTNGYNLADRALNRINEIWKDVTDWFANNM